jgi:hypothetical protein
MPDLDELTGFDPGLGAPMLPPSEVRRRGDRLRRRRTCLVAGGAALAVALAVGAPVLALSGGHDRDVQPAPSPGPSVAWVTAVPDGFPLADGFPTPSEVTTRQDPDLLPICGPWQMEFEDSAVVRYAGQSEDSAQRMLVLFKDANAARAQLALLRESTNHCAPVPGPPGSDVSLSAGPVPLDHVARQAEDTYAFAEQVRHDDGLVSDLTLVEVSRTGNALYFDSAYTSAGGDGVVASELVRLEQASQRPLMAMCVFSADPCSTTVGGPTAPVADTNEIPDGFALGTGFVTGPDEFVTGPSATINGVSFADACQAQVWPGPGVTDRLAVRLQGVEHGVVRELVTFEDSSRAADAVTSLTSLVAECPTSGSRVITKLEPDTGHQDSLTFGFTYTDGLGGALFQVVRVGHAVLATVETGEFAGGSLAAGVPTLTTDNRQVTELMCEFTAEGC